jgi:hypothetical protein
MSKKIFKPLRAIVGGKKKKPSEGQSGPIITPLGSGDPGMDAYLKRRRAKGNGRLPPNFSTLLTDKLGSNPKLGG